MALTFIGKDSNSPGGNCPSVWLDDDGIVLQGWRVDDEAKRAEINDLSPILPHEEIVKLPWRMAGMIAAACQSHQALASTAAGEAHA